MAQPKILIVDDDADHRQGLNLRLRANHYETVLAADAAQAVSAANRTGRTSSCSTSVSPATMDSS